MREKQVIGCRVPNNVLLMVPHRLRDKYLSYSVTCPHSRINYSALCWQTLLKVCIH